VPEAVAMAAAAHGLSVRQTDAFGEIHEIVELSRIRRHEAVAARSRIAAAETVLVMIGRGSSDPEAAAQLRSFTDATLGDEGAARPRRVELGFVAAARPRLDEAIAIACDPSDAEVRRIIVQPHLLFRGHVEDQVTDAVASGRERRPGVEWIQVPRLGADPLVARALARRVTQIADAENATESLSRQG